jgi:hypothetical protein
MFPNSLEIAINKKWLKNQSNLEEDEYESPTLVYCKEIDVMVPLVRAGLHIPPKMQGSWSDENAKISKAMVESLRGMDNKPSQNIKGSPQYYHRQHH